MVLVAFFGVSAFKEVVASSSLYSLALKGRAQNCPENLSGASSGIHGRTCCWSPLTGRSYAWVSRWPDLVLGFIGASLVSEFTAAGLASESVVGPGYWVCAGQLGPRNHWGGPSICVQRGWHAAVIDLEPGFMGVGWESGATWATLALR